tara:strand:+ start:2811 stop:3794 length:984 start_codon:yes stop_codon:yes gene_type:complete
MVIGYIGKFEKIYDEQGIALSLEKLGVKIVRIDQKIFWSNFQQTLDEIKSLNLDYLMSPKWPVPHLNKLFLFCKSHNIQTISYHPDGFYNYTEDNGPHSIEGNDVFHGSRHDSLIGSNKNLIYKADYVFTPEGYANSSYREMGINHYVLRQGIHNSCCYKGIPIYHPYDVAFIGNDVGPYHSYRKELTTFLTEKYGDKFLHLGRNNEHAVRMDNLNDLIASCKVIIGESIQHPNYWSNRIYETIGRGGFCLHAYHEGIENEYSIGKHFDVYYREEGFDKIKEKIDFWIQNDSLREKVANNGMNHTQKYHTLAHRASQLIQILNQNKK